MGPAALPSVQFRLQSKGVMTLWLVGQAVSQNGRYPGLRSFPISRCGCELSEKKADVA